MIKATPDELLDQIQQTEAEEKRGRLTIFFGSAPGVGKTYAMLSAAQVEKKRGVDVVIGIVETHKRKETELLVSGFECLMLKDIQYKGKLLKEFDLEAAVNRKPRLLLVDELAHTNLGESKHEKRWQDIEELLQIGIDVYTTLNVQHLESLNDVVTQIAGIRVWETVPDHVFNEASEVKIIDLPPDELLARLREGKIYMPQQIEMAREHFFKKGNLLALRELALRKIADRVDDQVCDYQEATSKDHILQTKDRLIVYLDLNLDPEGLIRSASRMAIGLRADWVVVAMGGDCKENSPCDDILKKSFELAEDLGAETHMLLKGDLVELLTHYALLYHATKILLQYSEKKSSCILNWWRMQAWMQNLSPIEICMVATEKSASKRSAFKWGIVLDRAIFTRFDLLGLVMPVVLSQIIFWSPIEFNSFIIFSLYGILSIGLALLYGSLSGILGLFMSALMSIAFGGDIEKWMLSYPIATASIGLLSLCTVVLVGYLSRRLRLQAKSVLTQTVRSEILYKMSKELSGASDLKDIVRIGVEHMKQIFSGKILILLQDRKCKLEIDSLLIQDIKINHGIAQWVYDHNQPAGLGTQTLSSANAIYLPLSAPMQVRGVVVLEPEDTVGWELSENLQLLQTFIAPLALAVERVHYLEIAQNALLNEENENFQGAILKSISTSFGPSLERILQLVDQDGNRGHSLKEEAERLRRLVDNLEDMTQLQSEQLSMEIVPVHIGDLIRDILLINQKKLTGYGIEVKMPSLLPLVHVDQNLITSLMWHLLENVICYTPLKTVIQIEARVEDEFLVVSVEDNGPGLPEGMEEKIFEKFTRGNFEELKVVGLGLGLSICRAIIEKHSGKIWADSLPGKGTRFTFRLPLINTA